VRYPDTNGIRSKYQSIEETFKPRLNEDIPHGAPYIHVHEALLADAIRTIRVLCDRIEALERGSP
jgi:hypothetical protein